MQHKIITSSNSPSRTNSAFDGKNGIVLRNLLKKPDQDFTYIKYFFLLDEMEARLHELVLSFYRAKKKLPINQDEFLDLLLGSKNVGSIFLINKKSHAKKISEGRYKPYKIRFEQADCEIFDAILCLKDEETMIRYIHEVLTVMYGTLLYLYGGEKEHSSYMKTVSCTDLYTELYGEIGR